MDHGRRLGSHPLEGGPAAAARVDRFGDPEQSRVRGSARRSRGARQQRRDQGDRKSTRLNSSHLVISYAVFCLKKKKKTVTTKLYIMKYRSMRAYHLRKSYY